MKKKIKILAVILARAGSKGVYQKNIRDLCGHPLISYSIYAAKKSKLISKLIISTDSLKIKKICENYGASVPFLRPKKLAKDHIWSRDALKHAVLKSENIYNEKYDFIVELPAVAPFRNSFHIDQAIKKLIKKKSDSVIAVSRVFDKHPIRIKRIQSGRIVDYNKLLKEGESSRRQDLPDAYIRNGSIYAMKRDTIVKHFSRKGNISLPFIMKEIESINIDEITDFYLAETLIKKGYCNNFPSLFFNERKADYKYKKNKNILITYNKEISQKVFEKFKYKNYGLIFSNFKNLNHIKYKDSIYALLVSTDGEIKINNTHLRKFKNLKYILSPSTGLTHLDIKSFDKNIKILNLNNFQKTKKIMASSEFTISLILNSVRKLDLINNVVLSNNWRNKENLLRGNELSNYKFGIFGFGRIGKNVANFLKQFNNNVFYFDPYVKNKLAKKVTNINVFLKKINFLIISAKLTNETNNFFTFKKLKLLKNNSILINVSRGELIKENDLIKLIQSNHFKKVSLDVLSNENNILNGRNSLIKLSRKDKRLFITPHIAGLTFESEYKALNEIKKLIYKNL